MRPRASVPPAVPRLAAAGHMRGTLPSQWALLHKEEEGWPSTVSCLVAPVSAAARRVQQAVCPWRGPLLSAVCQKQVWSQLRAWSALPLGSSGSQVCLAEFSKRRYCKQAAFRASLASPASSCAVLARCFRSQKVEKCHVRAFPVLTLLHV